MFLRNLIKKYPEKSELEPSDSSTKQHYLNQSNSNNHYCTSVSSVSAACKQQSMCDVSGGMQQHSLENVNIEIIEYLLKLKRDENVSVGAIVDHDGNTLMHKAIIYNQYDVVRYLVKSNPELVGLRNDYGLYPIHLCVIRSSMPILRLICFESRKHLNKRDRHGFTPAMYASMEGKYEVLKYLLDNAGAKFTKLTKNERLTLLHLGVQSGCLDVVQYLLYKMGASYLKCRSKDGATVYHLAAARGHDHILEYLLALQSSKLYKRLRDINGSTPAHDAAENGNFKCLKLLYDSGLDLFEEDMVIGRFLNLIF
jgi:ankyrin repeat protein